MRYQCQYCRNNPTTTQKLGWNSARSQQTKVYEAQVLLLLVNRTAQDVSREKALGFEAVIGIIDWQVANTVGLRTLTRLEIVGMDKHKRRHDFSP